MADRHRVIEARWVWTGERLQAHHQVSIDATGRVLDVGLLGLTPVARFPHHVLIPGFVNAHSHAFQRALRGHGERFPRGAGTFWTWRDEMYRLTDTFDPETFIQVCGQAFGEMLDAGITTVGEFHYLHHGRGQRDYSYDRLVAEAARSAGIRLVLLNAYYARGGFDQPLTPAQRRFASNDLEAFLDQLDGLSADLDSGTQSAGIVAHSLRAVAIEDIVALQEAASRRDMPFHIHVEEQRQEITDCVAVHGMTPMALLNDRLPISDRMTAVHCTHTVASELERFLAAGGNVCLCPLTEANLGDGIPDLLAMLDAPDQVSLGTDSNARISMTEEMRWLEYGQRLRHETRGVVVDADGRVGARLLKVATENGARALRVDAGRIAPGKWADFAVIDLEVASLLGTDETSAIDAFVLGTGNEAVIGVYVGGEWRPRGEE